MLKSEIICVRSGFSISFIVGGEISEIDGEEAGISHIIYSSSLAT